MGEPLNNYESVRDAVKMLTHSRLFGLSKKHVTISTVGVLNRIRSLHQDLPVSVNTSTLQTRCRNSTVFVHGIEPGFGRI